AFCLVCRFRPPFCVLELFGIPHKLTIQAPHLPCDVSAPLTKTFGRLGGDRDVHVGAVDIRHLEDLHLPVDHATFYSGQIKDEQEIRQERQVREHQKPLECRVYLVGYKDNAEEEKQTLVGSGPVDGKNPEEKIRNQKYQRQVGGLDLLIGRAQNDPGGK